MTIPFAQLSFPEMFERALVGPLFRPFAELLVDDVALTGGDRVLDVACGTGIVARLARERLGESGSVVGVDLSAPMLAVARRVAPGVEWREGDACALPLGEGEQFDVVLCQQGLQFFSDRSEAVRQMRRALVTGGRLAVSTWCSDEELPVLRELRRIAERFVGPISDRRHSFGEAGPLETLLQSAGFLDVRLKTVSRTIRFDEGPVFVRLNAMALVGMSAQSKGMTDDRRREIVEAIARDSAAVVESDTGAAGFSFELSATVATART